MGQRGARLQLQGAKGSQGRRLGAPLYPDQPPFHLALARNRLDSALTSACKEDIESTCSTPLADLKDNKTRSTAINCLQTFRDELKSDECRTKVSA
jgi:hypothetical protein